MRIIFGCLLFLLCVGSTKAQFLDDYLDDEHMFNAHTKQVNQFFRRFNGEEDTYGKKLLPNDTLYRNNYYRKNFLNHLFDERSYMMEDVDKFQFIDELTNLEDPIYLDFHSGEWVSEVNARFIYKDQEIDVSIYLIIQEEEVGSKWVISKIFFEPYTKFFREYDRDSIQDDPKNFLHPLSHELDFMNLIDVFQKDVLIERFAEKTFYPDHLSLFIYEFRKGLIKFKTIEKVKFHFFQIDGWYFELSRFNRKSLNSGWLISNLFKTTEEDQKVLKSLIYQK